MHPFSFGSDPELMLMTEQGELRSAIKIVHGNVHNRIEAEGHAFYHDNVNVEMAIRPGVGKTEVVENFRQAFKLCADMVAPFRLVARASADFPESELDDPESKVIGCNAEFCAYVLQELEKPVAEFETSTFRTAGGHIHLGADEGALYHDPMSVKLDFLFVVRCLDLFVGIPALWMDHDPTSARRREIYGLAGSHRYKPYGVEYRSISNFWLASPKLVRVVHDLCEFTIDFVEQGKHRQFWELDQKKLNSGVEASKCIQVVNNYPQDAIREAINTGDKQQGRQLLTLAESYMPRGLVKDVHACFEPVQYDFYKEWVL
jgi:hypothetical protein